MLMKHVFNKRDLNLHININYFILYNAWCLLIRVIFLKPLLKILSFDNEKFPQCKLTDIL